MKRFLRRTTPFQGSLTARLLVVAVLCVPVSCGSGEGRRVDGLDVSRRGEAGSAVRATDPSTGLPLPPTEAEQDLLEWQGSAKAPTDSLRSGGSTSPGMKPDLGDSDSSTDASSSNLPQPGNTASTIRPQLPTGATAVPPLVVSTPTPPPTMPVSSPTTVGTPITAPPSAPSATLVGGQTSTPFRCEVLAMNTGTSQVRRLIISVPVANRSIGWVYAQWPDSTSATTTIDLSRGYGQTDIVVTNSVTPQVFVFASPNRLASELGCSFTP